VESPELIAKLIGDGEMLGAASVFAAELHNQMQTCGDDIDEAMAAMEDCLPADPDLRKRLLALVPHVTKRGPGDG
jgi:hypothetical protein